MDIVRTAQVGDLDAKFWDAHPEGQRSPRLVATHRELHREYEYFMSSSRPLGVAIDSNSSVKGLMVGCLLLPDAADELLDVESGVHPMPKLVSRSEQGLANYPTDKEIGLACAGEGLSLFFPYVWTRSSLCLEGASGVRAELARSWIERFRGCRLKQVLMPAMGPYIDEAIQIGFRVHFRRNDPWGNEAAILIVTREEALAGRNVFLHQLFAYQAPILRLSPASRELLRWVSQGYTDAEIAEILVLSKHAVKKRWSAIYDGVARAAPEVFGGGEFGERTRRAIKDHIALHPQELWPYEYGQQALHQGDF